MCIICNTTDEAGAAAASDFIEAFAASRREMTKASGSMHDLLSHPLSPADRERYDRLHKRMRRLMRDWNRLEEERERPDPDIIDHDRTST